MLDDEVSAEAMQGLLNALVPSGVGVLDHRGHQRGGRRNEDTSAVEDQTVHDAPGRATLGDDGVPLGEELGVVVQLTAQVVEEGEGWPGQRGEVGVAFRAAREGIGDGVEST